MEFLNPTALFGLLALPLLLLPYLVRRKPRRVAFSSLVLLMDSDDQAQGRAWGRVHLPWIFFLQLLLLALLIFALSEPVFFVRPTNIAVVIDNSASMQTLENGRSRLALAKEQAHTIIGNLGVAGQIDLYLTTPRMEKVRVAPLTSTQAVSVIDGLESYDLGDPAINYDQTLNQLARRQKYDRVYLITDHPARGQSATVRVISVGEPHPNWAVTGFEVHRSSLTNARLEASVEVISFSNTDAKVKVTIRGNGSLLASREISVGAGKTAVAAFDSLADQPYYQAEIATEDALAVDNRRFAVAPTVRNLHILGISLRPKELASLKSLPGVQIDVITPSEYGKAEHRGYGLEIFHFAAPAELPQSPALFILPPAGNSLAELAAPVPNVKISSWRELHPLTRYVNFNLFSPTYARPLKPRSPGSVIIESPDGALAFASERHGARYLTLGFDPFPYLGRENLPMSIFTLNVLDWFFESGMPSQATGEPIALGTILPGDLLINPKGEKLSLKTGYDYFSGTFQQGIYQRSRGSERELLARNLQDSKESDLRAPAPIELRGGSENSGGAAVLFSFWPYLLIASLALFFLEWFLNPRKTTAGILHRRATRLGSI
jgi:hypothetical protein